MTKIICKQNRDTCRCLTCVNKKCEISKRIIRKPELIDCNCSYCSVSYWADNCDRDRDWLSVLRK